MAVSRPIAQTPSLSNQASPQVIQQRRERDTAQRLYAEQERRNQEIRRQEEEARRSEQNRAYADVSKAADNVNDTGDKLEKAANRYNDLIDRYNASTSDKERISLRRDIERAREEYNALSSKYESDSGVYNMALNYAQATGAISSGDAISYKRETITSPFEGTEADLKERQKQRQDLYLRKEAEKEINELVGEVNRKSASLSKSGSEYNKLIDEFNSAQTADEQKRIKGLIENKAAEYNLLSGEFESVSRRYDSAISSAKARGFIDDSAASPISYSRQTVNPLFEEVKTEQQPKQEIPKTWEGLVNSGLVRVSGTGAGAKGETLITAAEMKQTKPANDPLKTVASDLAAGAVSVGVGLIGVGETLKGFIGNAGTVLTKETDNIVSNAAVGALSLITLGKTVRQGIGSISDNGIPGNPLTQEYTLPGGITWQPQKTASQEAEEQKKRQEDEFNSRIAFFGDSSKYFANLSDDLKTRRPKDSEIAKGMSDFMKFNQGEAERDKAFVMDGAVSISDEGISFNRPSVYLAGAAALTGAAAGGLAALSGGAAALAPEGAAVLGANSIRGGGTATATANTNPVISGAGGIASETGKQNAALYIPSSEVKGGTGLFTESEVANVPLSNSPEIVSRRISGVTPELFAPKTTGLSELGSTNKLFSGSEISVNRINIDAGTPYSTGNTLIEGYPVRGDKLAQLERIGINSPYSDSTGNNYGYGNGNSLLDRDDTKTVGRVGIGNLNRTRLENQDLYRNRSENETRNRNRYEYGYRYAPGFRFENVRKIKLPDIDLDLKSKGEKKKGGKKKRGKAVLVEHYLPSSKEFIGSFKASGKKSGDLFKSKSKKRSRKDNLLF